MNAKVVFVPDLRNAVTVTPDTISALAAGQSATVTLTFAPAATDTRKVIAGIVLLFDKNATTSRPLPVKVSLVAPETVNGIAVPPEPPADLNNATLAGFDVNGNGVRDDVERLIASTHGTSSASHSEAMSFSAAQQKMLVESTPEAIRAYAKTASCGSLRSKQTNPFTYLLMNSDARKQRYRTVLAGYTSSDQGC